MKTALEVRRRRVILEERTLILDVVRKETQDELKALKKQCPHENSRDEDFIEGPDSKTFTVCQDCDAQKRSWEESFPS